MLDDLFEEFVGLSELELDEQIRRAEAENRASAARSATLLAGAMARQIHLADAHHSIKGYHRATCNWSNTVIDLGRKQRLFTGSARVAAKLLARRCSHPGCDVTATFSDVDHIDEWARSDGATDQRNADIQCGKHDRFKHRERWRTRRSTNGRPYSIRPDGTIVLPVGERLPNLTIDESQRTADTGSLR